jgi:hypothetical protein
MVAHLYVTSYVHCLLFFLFSLSFTFPSSRSSLKVSPSFSSSLFFQIKVVKSIFLLFLTESIKYSASTVCCHNGHCGTFAFTLPSSRVEISRLIINNRHAPAYVSRQMEATKTFLALKLHSFSMLTRV